MRKIFKVICCVFLTGSCSSTLYPTPKAPLLQGEQPSEHYDHQKKMMVVSQGPYTTAAALKMLDLGGNAVDAAIAASFTISVERPHSTGIGGGGFALVHVPHHDVEAIDFRERSPEKSNAQKFLSSDAQPLYQKSQVGGLAVATPGLVAGLHFMHQKYGKLPWEKLLEPAIKLASEGFIIYPELDVALQNKKDILKNFASSQKIFFDNQGNVLKLGDKLIQSDLAKTLSLIAQKKDKGFYYGSVAKNIVKSTNRYEGVLSLSDLRKYRVKERRPVHTHLGEDFKDVDIYSMPPPSSGGIHVLQILNMVEALHTRGKFQKSPWNSENVHLTALAMQQAFYDRAVFLGDPDFVKIPVPSLISKDYAQRAIQTFNTRAKKWKEIKTHVSVGDESLETTHFSIVDKDGMVVSSTQTINGWFGSGLVADNTGIVLNNEMDDFALSLGGANLFGAYGGEKNLIEPLKTPLSSMSPTIVLKNKKPFLVLGSPSGTRIISCVALTLLNYLYYNVSLLDAVNVSRYHHQWSPDELWVEKEVMNTSVTKKLQKKGYHVLEKELGCKVQAIGLLEDNTWEGVSDFRGKGLARGL